MSLVSKMQNLRAEMTYNLTVLHLHTSSYMKLSSYFLTIIILFAFTDEESEKDIV